MEIKGLKIDNNGHLVDVTRWTKGIGSQMAELDGLNLNENHWQVINLIRDIYLKTHTTPPMRLLIKAIEVNISKDSANSRYLYQLFPEGPVKLACKYGGLPKPKHCL